MSDQPENPYRADAESYPQPRTGFGMSHGAMAGLAILTVLCILVTVAVPALGIPVAVLLAPPYVRASMGAYRHRLAGKPLTQGNVMALFVTSFLILSLVTLASSIAFGVICTAVVLGDLSARGGGPPIVFGLSFAGLAAIGTYWLLARVFARLPAVGGNGSSTAENQSEVADDEEFD